MRLVEQQQFHKGSVRYKSLDEISFLSKNLYNSALYTIKKEFSETGKWIRYNELEKKFKMENQPDYRALPNNSSQQILMLLDTNLMSYFRALRAFKRNKTAFKGCPKFPKFKDKLKGRNVVIFTYNQFRVKEGVIYFPKKSGIVPLKTNINVKFQIKQIRIVPRNKLYVIELVYEFQEKIKSEINSNWISIDLGLNNLATCISSKDLQPLIINGRPLKSINQYYNKQKSKLQSKLGQYLNYKGEKKQYTKSNKLTKLGNKRTNKINDYLHKSSKMIIDYCLKNDIDNIVLGKNDGWKQDINIGSRNNQNFVQIPFDRFESYLSYKAQKEGIVFKSREESYTSKASALDLDNIPTYRDDSTKKFSGKRIKRGLYKSKEGFLLNSDVNGSINILRKEIGDDWLKPILFNRGLRYSPLKVNPL